MIFDKFEIDGPILIKPDIFGDNRGYFLETYNQQKFDFLSKEICFVQDNLSYSKKNTIRGLHFQEEPYAQGKLCRVIKGKVLDVAVDIRPDSKTFGKYVALELSGENNHSLWIPAGFAHGFSVLSEEAYFLYKCTNYYNKESERCILYNDSSLNINWQVEDPVVSIKDLEGKPFLNL